MPCNSQSAHCSLLLFKQQTYRRNLLGKINILGQLHGTLLQRTLEIDILEVVAQVGFLVDDANQAILDLQVHLCALLNVLGQNARGLDGQSDATITRRQISFCSRDKKIDAENSRRRRVGRQVDLVNGENVVLGGGAEEQRVVARNGELFFKRVLRVAADKAEAAR